MVYSPNRQSQPAPPLTSGPPAAVPAAQDGWRPFCFDEVKEGMCFGVYEGEEDKPTVYEKSCLGCAFLYNRNERQK